MLLPVARSLERYLLFVLLSSLGRGPLLFLLLALLDFFFRNLALGAQGITRRFCRFCRFCRFRGRRRVIGAGGGRGELVANVYDTYRLEVCVYAPNGVDVALDTFSKVRALVHLLCTSTVTGESTFENANAYLLCPGSCSS